MLIRTCTVASFSENIQWIWLASATYLECRGGNNKIPLWTKKKKRKSLHEARCAQDELELDLDFR